MAITNIPLKQGGTGQDARQDAIDALTDVGSATTGHVLTKDGSGNATFQAATSSGGVFESAASDTVIREASGTNQYARDFIVGSDTMDYGSYEARMFWNHKKYAFRTGYDDANSWDNSTTGYGSFATGENTSASGNSSFAIGVETTASGEGSFSAGEWATASGQFSVALCGSNASGDYSLSMADGNAVGDYSVSLGGTSSGNRSVSCYGGNVTSSGLSGFAHGVSVVYGEYGFSSGFNSIASSYAEASFGHFGIPKSGTADSWVSADTQFSIGNGADNLNRSDAFNVLKNGNIGIGNHIAPVSKLSVKGRTGTAITTITSNTTLSNAHSTVLVDASSNAVTVTLPTAASAYSDGVGGRFSIKAIDTSNTVTVDADGTETIDGSLTFVFASQYDAIEIQSDGSNWFII